MRNKKKYLVLLLILCQIPFVLKSEIIEFDSVFFERFEEISVIKRDDYLNRIVGKKLKIQGIVDSIIFNKKNDKYLIKIKNSIEINDDKKIVFYFLFNMTDFNRKENDKVELIGKCINTTPVNLERLVYIIDIGDIKISNFTNN